MKPSLASLKKIYQKSIHTMLTAVMSSVHNDEINIRITGPKSLTLYLCAHVNRSSLIVL